MTGVGDLYVFRLASGGTAVGWDRGERFRGRASEGAGGDDNGWRRGQAGPSYKLE
jgi:hypothetical protein